MQGWRWKNWFISSLHFTLKSYLRDIENCSLLKFLLEPLCLFPALFTMISTKNSITLANIGHGAGSGVGKVITQPITEAMPGPNRKVQFLRASCKLEEISDHLISQALDRSQQRGEASLAVPSSLSHYRLLWREKVMESMELISEAVLGIIVKKTSVPTILVLIPGLGLREGKHAAWDEQSLSGLFK